LARDRWPLYYLALRRTIAATTERKVLKLIPPLLCGIAEAVRAVRQNWPLAFA
jgi:hypothetical protein